jgi:hypothetical protein
MYLRKLVESRWFALSAFVLVIASGICLYALPQFGIWVLLPPLILWMMRCAARRTLHLHPLLVSSLIVFTLTAASGYWAAYDATAAWDKFRLILAAIVFCVVIAGQPFENLKFLGGFWFVIGVGIAGYFLLTFDFSAQTPKFELIHQLGLAWMRLRPVSLALPSIHPNDVGGLAIIMSVYGLALFRSSRAQRGIGFFPQALVIVGFGIVLMGVLLASSRGAFLAFTGAIGIWFLGRFLQANSPVKENLLPYFPGSVVIGSLLLGTLILILPSSLLGPSFAVAESVVVSRAELFRSGLSILGDFPFTGGGLTSFPGLYSQYVVVLPYFTILHSHNMFLDVMIEQGVLGGISFIIAYLVVIWQLLHAWSNDRSPHRQHLYFAACISLFTAVFHGWVDDYIYGGRGTILAFVPVAMAVLVSRISAERDHGIKSRVSHRQHREWLPWLSVSTLAVALVLLSMHWNAIMAQWYANLGAVKMARVELANYPANKWSEGEHLVMLTSAELDFQRSLAFQPDNQTANHRLGLIRMSARDFQSASQYLQQAYEKDLTDRGILKNLGYSYLWLGETERAQPLLSKIPEAKHELEVYIWWWGKQQRPDLSDLASQLATHIVVTH